jgi:hypothetical protein
MMPIAAYYLGTNPTSPTTATSNRPQSMSQISAPKSPESPPDSSARASNRASMPAPSRIPTGNPSSFVNQTTDKAGVKHFEPTVEESGEETQDQLPRAASEESKRIGQMNKNFKFPPDASESEPTSSGQDSATDEGQEDELTTVGMVVPSSIEVHPPPPVEKEKAGSAVEDGEVEDVGPTEEISLN